MKYDFKDLMAFGTFILALLTFIFYNCKQQISLWSPENGQRKTTLVYFGEFEGGISTLLIGQPLVMGRLFLYYYSNT